MRLHWLGFTLLAATAGHAQSPDSSADASFRAVQSRGRLVMGVDQYSSSHRFDALPDGGRIVLQREVDDTADISRIRAHLTVVAAAFAEGDFRLPGLVHDTEVPGTRVMAARRAAIRYRFRELPRGGEVQIETDDPDAVKAIHDFLAFQRSDHRAEGSHQH